MDIISKTMLVFVVNSLLVSTAFADGSFTRFGNYKNIAKWESTSSTAFTDLATPDQLTVNLPANGFVTVLYHASVSALGGASGCPGTAHNIVNIDGVDRASSDTFGSLTTSYPSDIPLPTTFTIPLNAGNHVVKVRHRSNNGCSFFWHNRSLTVLTHRP